MRYDNKKQLIEKLGQIALNIDQALLMNRNDEVKTLFEAHNDIMTELNNTDDNMEADSEMKDLILTTEKNVLTVITRIQAMQTDIRNQLTTMNNKRLIKSAYNMNM